MKLLTVVLGILLVVPASHAQGNSMQAVLSNNNISLGQSASLQLTIHGSRSANPALPKVDGLEFETAGQSSQFSWVNGSMSSSVTLLYRVVPTRAGDFTIPPITCKIDGKEIQTQPLTLHVVKDNSVAPAGTGAVSTPAPPAGANRQPIFGKITGIPDKMYIGQVIPATISFYINRNARVRVNQIGIPTLKSDAFSISTIQPDQLRQAEQVINGVPYYICTVEVSLTALKEGNFDLSAAWPLTVITTESSDSGQGDSQDPFNDPFFRSIFRRQVEKPYTVNSIKSTVQVLPLPTAGQPASFAGAVGHFELHVSADPAQVRVGDPLTLRIEISGQGNFDRINEPVLDRVDGWRSYPASSHFTPGSATGIEGVKAFTQALIPEDAKLKTLPGVEFSYFDPQNRKYVTLRPALPTVAILAPEPGHGVPAGQTQQLATTRESEQKGSALAPLRLEEGEWHAEWRPYIQSPFFLGASSIPLLLGLAGFFLIWRYRRHQADPYYHLHKKMDAELSAALRRLDTALASEDSAAFADAMGQALQIRLAGCWHMDGTSITAADVRQRLGQAGEPVAHLFDMADAVTYAGRRFNRDEMINYKKQILEQLNQLEKYHE